jgi:hypothetical protein
MQFESVLGAARCELNLSTLPSESHVKSTRVARRVGCSFKRCSGMIGKTCPTDQ